MTRTIGDRIRSWSSLLHPSHVSSSSLSPEHSRRGERVQTTTYHYEQSNIRQMPNKSASFGISNGNIHVPRFLRGSFSVLSEVIHQHALAWWVTPMNGFDDEPSSCQRSCPLTVKSIPAKYLITTWRIVELSARILSLVDARERRGRTRRGGTDA